MEPILEQLAALSRIIESILVKAQSLQDRQRVIDFMLILVLLSFGYYLGFQLLLALAQLFVAKEDRKAIFIRRSRWIVMASFVIHAILQWKVIGH